MQIITDILTNSYLLSAVAGAAASRWVIPPVWTALLNDVIVIWTKYFPAKTV